jgi:hypothetical protein
MSQWAIVQVPSNNFQSVTDIPSNGKPVGAGLPAMAACQSTMTLNDKMSSLASQLPQVFVSVL